MFVYTTIYSLEIKASSKNTLETPDNKAQSFF